MNSVLFDTVADLLPHQGYIVLLSGVSDWGDDSAEFYVEHDGKSPFADRNGDVPSWVGIEYMAQSISAFSGIIRKSSNQDVKLGFLLGTNKYKVNVDAFLKGTRVHIYVERVFHERNSVALFSCTIKDGEHVLAQAELKAIQPDDPLALFSGGSL